MSGYDVKKLVDSGLSHFWNENYGQIYPTLEKLSSEGLATKTAKPTPGKRPRFVYSITSKGRRELSDWLAAPNSLPTVRNEMQLKFFLSGVLAVEEQVRLVAAYQAQQQALLHEYRQSESVLRAAIEDEVYSDELQQLLEIASSSKQQAERCRMFFFTLRHGIHVIEARLAWCNEVLETLHPKPKRHRQSNKRHS